MKTQSTLKVVKATSGGVEYKYIYVYYKANGKMLRIPTQCQYIEGKMTKHLMYTSLVKGHADQNQRMREIIKRVDEYIAHKIRQPDFEVNQVECQAYIHNRNYKLVGDVTYFNNIKIYEYRRISETTNRDDHKKTINDYYSDFYEFKERDLYGRPGFKDYKTIRNVLIDYQRYHNVELTLEDVDNLDFMVNLRIFLIEKRDKKLYISEGGLNDNTINKRIILIKAFFRWLEVNEVHTFKKEVFKFVVPTYQNDVIALNQEEMDQLINLKLSNPKEQRIIDVFICNCYIGLRFSDLKNLKKYMFKQDDKGDYFLTMQNQKTGTKINVPITDRPLKILEKYNFELPVFSNQHFNREIKNILQKKQLFKYDVDTKRRVNNEYTTTRKPKNEVISSHTCRRTFITLCLNAGVAHNALMGATGHTKLATLQIYASKVNSLEQFKKLDL